MMSPATSLAGVALILGLIPFAGAADLPVPRWQPHDTPPSSAYFKHLRDFFEGTNYWLMAPVEGLSSVGSCLAEPGREYVVFVGEAAPFTLQSKGAAGPLAAEWFRPLAGERRGAGSVKNGRVDFLPPAGWTTGPLALPIRAAP